MTRLARRSDGTPLIGTEDGFVTAAALDHDLTDERHLLAAAADGTLPDPHDAPVRMQREAELGFQIPLEDLGKLWGIGLNYTEHATDLDEQSPDEPASFMKPRTTAVADGGPIRLPPPDITSEVTAEAELGVVIGRECSDIEPAAADDVVAGFVPVIDMTAEDILRRNPRFLTRSKSFDSFLVVGPWITVTPAVDALDDVGVETIRNGEVAAENTVSNMCMQPAELVAFHSRVMTLEPGDVILTGTPGAARIEPGDTVSAAVDRVGRTTASVIRS